MWVINKFVGVKLDSVGKFNFQKIIKVLNSFQDKHGTEFSKILDFRKRIELADVANFEIYVERQGSFEFGITCVYGDEVNNWIHIDGIAEERKRYTEKGIFNHPVFEITCLSDIVADINTND